MIIKLFFISGLVFIGGVVAVNLFRLSETPPPSAISNAKSVSFPASDGVSIQADWFASTRTNARTVVLVHMLGRDRHSWGVLPDKLRVKDFAVLALDLRGHGQSVAGTVGALNFADFSDNDWSKVRLDLQAALSFLADQKISPAQVSLLGASIGANAALIAAADTPALRSVVLLSPAENYHGLMSYPAASNYKGRRALIIASSEDTPSYPDSQKIAERIGSPANFVGQNKLGHGTEMLATDPSLADQIISYLLTN